MRERDWEEEGGEKGSRKEREKVRRRRSGEIRRGERRRLDETKEGDRNKGKEVKRR